MPFLPPEPSGPPLAINATHITSSSITIVWSPPDILDANGPITGYVLSFTRLESGGFTQNFTLKTLFYTERGGHLNIIRYNIMYTWNASLPLLGLLPYEQVSVRVAAMTTQGQGPFSRSYKFQTAESGIAYDISTKFYNN